ncbi:MAG: hypothetical protein KJO23_07105 [Bacteroidia bacterium]|nr:hypothetical protein [Bacteroidia bacterium]NNM23771.1 hypothetical protein [Flavobacteriaceae bacterium]
MKKKLQSQIQELARQILAESDSKDTGKMKETARRLYEQLTVLEYLEVQIFGSEEPAEKVESLDSKSFRENNWFKEPEPVPQPEDREAIVEPVMEKIKDLVAQMPEESQKVDALLEEVLPRKEYQKNDLEDFASDYQEMPVFEPKDNLEVNRKEKNGTSDTPTHNDVDRPKSLNEKLNNGLNIGLNDRLAFIKHLFNGSTEDYTRVIGQINSYQSFEEADTFIKAKVKPDYNYWLQKDEFSKRFMKIIKKSFE